MALMYLTDIVDVSWWGFKKVYSSGYWLLYGTPETAEEKIIKKMDELKNMQPDGTYREEFEEKIINELREHNRRVESQAETHREDLLHAKEEFQEQLEELRTATEEELAEIRERLQTRADHSEMANSVFNENDLAFFYKLMSEKS